VKLAIVNASLLDGDFLARRNGQQTMSGLRYIANSSRIALLVVDANWLMRIVAKNVHWYACHIGSPVSLQSPVVTMVALNRSLSRWLPILGIIFVFYFFLLVGIELFDTKLFSGCD
jgi:hypothetical protein